MEAAVATVLAKLEKTFIIMTRKDEAVIMEWPQSWI